VLPGEHNALGVQATAEELRAIIPDLTLVRIAGTGHLSNLEEPEMFSRVVRQFFASR
jgi:pimeloyl-ACP methyl ester carboxylesterase